MEKLLVRKPRQSNLFGDITTAKKPSNGEANKLQIEDRPAHDWYRFVLSYPPHIVRDYLTRFQLRNDMTVLDPFCGTGTTMVEAKKNGIPSIGIEANPLAFFASTVKVDWKIDPDLLRQHATDLAQRVQDKLHAEGIDDNDPESINRIGKGVTLRTLPADSMKLLLARSICPLPLHKALVLLETLDEEKHAKVDHHERLALAKALVFSISNLHFGPEVGVSKPKGDSPVIAPWLKGVETMAQDLLELGAGQPTPSTIHHADARDLLQVLKPHSIDAVITSPPYPNEKDYTRTTRLESVLLGFVKDKSEQQAVKRGLLRSNTRNVYKGDADDQWVAQFPEIQRIAAQIEARRLELGKTSGFERLYPKVTKLYFGGMARHFAELRTLLRPNAQLAYVVGDQASYLQVMIRTGQLLADIAQSLGYEVVSIDLFRTRIATATKEQLREEVLVLRWPG